MNTIRYFPVADRWCVHSYYTMCPYAPDGSGRILISGCDLRTQEGEVIILSSNGDILDRFGRHPIDSGFYHTGLWQTWSPDARHVYYQAGSMDRPQIARRELATGDTILMDGDMEGAPPDGEPILSGLMGMLYAAGYADTHFYPDKAPVPFQNRNKHGIFEYYLSLKTGKLRLSVADMLRCHPQREKLEQADDEIRRRLGKNDGLTLMLYCLRWNSNGSRFLFYFGNHCVDKSRSEPKIAYVMTSDRTWRDIHLAVDLSFNRPGVHWSWQPDGEHLIGYGPDPENLSRMCLASVRYDGSHYHKLSQNATGGHPSLSPVDSHLIVTDNYHFPGTLEFIDAVKDQIISSHVLTRSWNEKPKACRNPERIDLHPVFHPSGRKVLINTMQDHLGVIAEIDIPTRRSIS